MKNKIGIIHMDIQDLLPMSFRHISCASRYFIQADPEGLDDFPLQHTSAGDKARRKSWEAFVSHNETSMRRKLPRWKVVKLRDALSVPIK